jgi:hypothetical protein
VFTFALFKAAAADIAAKRPPQTSQFDVSIHIPPVASKGFAPPPVAEEVSGEEEDEDDGGDGKAAIYQVPVFSRPDITLALSEVVASAPTPPGITPVKIIGRVAFS